MKNYVQLRSTAASSRFVALAVAATFAIPTLAGCGGNSAPPAPTNAPGGNLPRPVGAPGASRQNTGMSTRNKVILLAGAAALYYMYKKRQNAAGQTVQYYKSESTGRIYYRDPKTKQAIWVTPPTQPIQIPQEQAREYSNYQGYNNQPTGQSWGGYNNGQFAPGSDRM